MVKYRIGIIGAENSHADCFAREINLPDENGVLRYPDCRVTMVYGHYPEANEALAQKYQIDRIASSVEEMVGEVDAVMITARDGKYHYEFARPFVEAGIPAFVDKPFTVEPAEASALITLAKEKNVPLCGGSSLKFADGIMEFKKYVKETDAQILGGSLSAPVSSNSEYSGFFFYSSHLVEMTLEIFGYNPRCVTAVKHETSICATVHYDRFSVSNHFKETSPDYSAVVYTSDGTHLKKVDLDNCGERECAAFVDMLRTGRMHNTYEELMAPVYYMNAVKNAYETGITVDIPSR